MHSFYSRFVFFLFFLRVIPDFLYLTVIRLLHRNVSYSSSDLVSIIVPTYNRSRLFIERTLPSLLRQTHQNIEIILVGDCPPPDHDKEYLAASLLHNFKYYSLSKRGNYPNDTKNCWFVAGSVPNNYGLSVASGKWICHCDDDDIFTPDHVETLLKHAVSRNCEFVSAAYAETTFDLRTIKVFRPTLGNYGIGGIQTVLFRSYLRFFKYSLFSYLKSWDCPTDIDRKRRMQLAGVTMSTVDKVVTLIAPRSADSTTIGLKQHLDGFD